ncbi:MULTISPECIES: hypothetical protein [unclassified Mesorhizobium]|nr:hypothetical protein [Mesorhizobium sp. L103C105A0]
MSEVSETPRKAKGSRWVAGGWIVTGIYVLLVAWALASGGYVEFKTPLSLNDFAAVLTGVFAPPAFLWLAVATMVQSGELALQREELQLTRQEFVQSREVAKEQALEAKNQAHFIEVQTGIFASDAADRHLDAMLQSLVELLLQKFQNPMVVRASNGDTQQIRGLASGDVHTLGGMVDSVRGSTSDLRKMLMVYPDAKVYILPGPLKALKSTIGELRAHIPGVSAARRAVLAASNFRGFLHDADYILSVSFTGT